LITGTENITYRLIAYLLCYDDAVFPSDLSGHNIIHTTSKRRVAIPIYHKSKPVAEPIKNKDIINDNAAPKNRTI
jgi:hypothetical protein